MTKHSILSAVLILAACAGSHDEQVRDARMEQADARAAAQKRVADENAEARKRAIEQRYNAVSANLEATNPSAKEAKQEHADVSKERLEYQSDAKKKLDELGADLNEAHAKIEALGSEAPISIKSDFVKTTEQYKTLADEVKSLDKTPPSIWKATTEQVDERMSRLEDRIDDLMDDIEDV
jgi:chromosome segregation ATPase